jgi:hypothetical protein
MATYFKPLLELTVYGVPKTKTFNSLEMCAKMTGCIFRKETHISFGRQNPIPIVLGSFLMNSRKEVERLGKFLHSLIHDQNIALSYQINGDIVDTTQSVQKTIDEMKQSRIVESRPAYLQPSGVVLAALKDEAKNGTLPAKKVTHHRVSSLGPHQRVVGT